ncbi:MAG: ATP-binding cassette domain-containing protein, partial [Thaumarchaeota archaeon]
KPHEVSSLGVARTFQTVRPFARMSARENVMAGLLFGRSGIIAPRRATQKALEILELVSLLDKAEVRAGHLTLAEQRRLELARALATSPKLLMLDEVVAGLNHPEMNAMVDLLRRIQPERRMALIVIEHVMKAIVRLCNRIVVMNGGEKLVEGSPSEVMRDERVVAAYMGRRGNDDGESTTTTSSSAPQ